METHSPEQDLLTDFEVHLQPAGYGKRFANYIIDLIVYFVVLVVIMSAYYTAAGIDPDADVSALFTLMVALGFGLLFGGVEGICKGKSLGKLITGTRAVNADGTNISFKTAILRGLSRLVPFEPFSAFGQSPPDMWHDRWTNTYVIDEKGSTRRKK